MSTLTDRTDLQSFAGRQKPLWNISALAYTLIGYTSSIVLILQPNPWLNALGIIVLTHSLIYSAYFSHEFMHGTIFSSRRWNAVWGTVMLWLNGSCYGTFDKLSVEHIAHHINRVDFSGFDLPQAIRTLPQPIRWLVLGLEWMYVPAIAFWLRWRNIGKAFQDPKQRLRTLAILLIRGSLFTLLAWLSPIALLLYFVAFIGMIHALRIMDAFQHTYEVFLVGTPLPERSREHEQANTFSTLISLRHRWLNLLLLNFGYHNAHHEVMKCPWHSLPELDRTLYTGDEVHYITLPQLLRNYHRFRIHRIFSDQGQAYDENNTPTPDRFYGAVGVSFLTVF
ncbi:MAG: fatty acid desaturase [Cyanobacteria bacterium P01_A01_bin.3]